MSPPERDQPSPEIPPTRESDSPPPSPSDTLSTHGLAPGPPDAGPPAPGPVGMRYRVLRSHAEGGLGEVLVAYDEELDREVALKQLHPQFADQARNRERFVREARLTGLLEHPGVVPIYGLGTYPDGRPFYAMRLIKGDSLRQAIERHHAAPAAARRPLGLRLLLARFVNVCNAVAYAHSKGIIHRDLKPDNVMLGEFGETLVVDWGLAKPLASGGAHSSPSPSTVEGRGEADPCHPPLLPPRGEGGVHRSGSDLTAAGGVLGTPAYMSPEQAAGKLDELGPASDVYSLGATLYHLLVGRAPFDGRNMVDVLNRVRRGAFVPPRRTGVP